MTQWLKDIKWEAYQYFSPRIWVCWDGWVCSWVEFHSSYWWCWTGVCSSWGPSRPRWPGASPCTLHWRSLHQVSLTQSHPTWKIVIPLLVRRGVLSVLPVEVREGPLEGPAGGSPLAPVRLWHAQSVLPLNIPLTPLSSATNQNLDIYTRNVRTRTVMLNVFTLNTISPYSVVVLSSLLTGRQSWVSWYCEGSTADWVSQVLTVRSVHRSRLCGQHHCNTNTHH